jgi:hypothetical protein
MVLKRGFITTNASFPGVQLRKRSYFFAPAKLPWLKELSIRCTTPSRSPLGSTVYIRLIFTVFSVCGESYAIGLILLCMSRKLIFFTNVICWRRKSFQSTTTNSHAPSLSFTTCRRLASTRIIIVASATASRASWSHTSANSNGFFSIQLQIIA